MLLKRLVLLGDVMAFTVLRDNWDRQEAGTHYILQVVIKSIIAQEGFVSVATFA